MRILLPPSEAKAAGGRGKPCFDRPVSVPWQSAREPVFAALARLCAQDAATAARALLLPPSVAESALADNGRVRHSGTVPALKRYRGVLYDGLAAETFSNPQRRLAGSTVLIFSGLFGVLTGADPVPAYRVPAKATLPGLGALSTYWRPRLTSLVPDLLDDGLIVDLRSSDYRSMWLPARGGEPAARHLSIRILTPGPAGRLSVVSHPSKLAKGELAAALVRRASGGEPVRTADDVAAAWAGLGGTEAQAVGPGSLDLIQ